ncbi:hypothetical protein [Chitinophaga sp. CF418]|uniref:hypothetical protein n=1 Tax=Chitinophaga sp. CF418 TaxID=1855287 RepID=UPI0009117E8C|nr:hypothetical protein [Chitinophaga sp. CF418]SHM74968.1 hypothetical protein SAMN05216311_103144 [Chitinophaga sp. CF418]
MSSFSRSRLKEQEKDGYDRKRNTRQERAVKEDLPRILLSFKDFDPNQIPPGQSFSEWEANKTLSALYEKFRHVCELNIVEAKQQQVIKVYGAFPDKSDFKPPTYLQDDDIQWAVITNIKGQKGRLAGHMIGNVFYVVFLDQEHRFFISTKKGT